MKLANYLKTLEDKKKFKIFKKCQIFKRLKRNKKKTPKSSKRDYNGLYKLFAFYGIHDILKR